MRLDIRKKISEDEDFVHSPKFDNSVRKVINKNPNGLDDSKIADMLCIKVEEVELLFQSAIKKIRQKLKIKVD
jgi:hypothetical protein